jgi:vesicle coat complex subunit
LAYAFVAKELIESSTSTTFVKKKAALTLLRLYRKHPTVLPVTDWADRIVSMMDDTDPGVALTAASLVMTMAQENLDAFGKSYQKAVDRLDRVSFRFNALYGIADIPRSFSMVIILLNTYTTKCVESSL